MGMGMGGAITVVAATTMAGIAAVIVVGGIITTGGVITIGGDFTPQTIGLRPVRGTWPRIFVGARGWEG